MPPKKRQKTQSNLKAWVPQNVSQVAAGRVQLKDWINMVHGGRRGFPEARKFPLNRGGSFLDIVQRCWCDETTLVSESHELVKKLGIMDSSTSEEDFIEKYLKLEDIMGCVNSLHRQFVVCNMVYVI